MEQHQKYYNQMITDTHISDYLKQHTQQELADQLGFPFQSAIGAMVRNGRNVYIRRNLDGSVSAYEVKEIKPQRSA